MENNLYIGLMSGTSMDGIDAALVEFGDRSCQVHASRTDNYPHDLRQNLVAAKRDPLQCTLDDVGTLDRLVGECFRDAVLALLDECGLSPSKITAIGSHGQTLRHQPQATTPFTIQVGDPAIIAVGTGITTIADFRRQDMAVGGQGAPLAPAFHDWLFNDKHNELVVLNIGGIANITILPTSGPVTGFDTGPGNTLLDLWIRENQGKDFDADGAWASQGCVSPALLAALLDDGYFSQAPPKSTGFEHFNSQWLQAAISACDGQHRLEPADVQATLIALTAQSVAEAVRQMAPETSAVLVCGGGVHNSELMRRLADALPTAKIESTQSRGLSPDSVEAAAFAWLAKRRLECRPGNLPSVTGANQAVPLGAVYLCTS